jgi:hypothetical protein
MLCVMCINVGIRRVSAEACGTYTRRGGAVES